MYVPNLPYPVDRYLAPLYNNNMAPNLNYRLYNIPVQLVQFAPTVALFLATMISQGANQSPLRVYFFNKYSRNNWENDDFRSITEATCNLIVQMNVNVADQGQLMAACDDVIKYYVAYNFGIDYSVFSQILDVNTQQILLNYIQAKRINIPGMNFQQPTYAPQGVSIGASFGQPMASPVNQNLMNQSSLDSDRYGQAEQQSLIPQYSPGVINVERDQHSAGVSPHDVQTPLTNSRTFNYEEPIIRDDISPLRHESKTFDSSNEIFDSMSDLSNKIFSDYEAFFRSEHTEFKYIIIRNFDYMVGAAPFTKEIKSLNIVQNFINFIDDTISKEQMNDVANKIPGRVKKLFIIFLEEIRLLTNNLIATNKCRTALYNDLDKTFIDDYNDLLLNLTSKGRDDIISDLKIALHTWIGEMNLFSIREYDDEEGKSSTVAVAKLNVIVVNVSSKVFSGYRLADLDFLCELRVMTLYVITNNNVLFKVEFGSKYEKDKTKYYVPMDILKIGTLL